MQTAGVYMESPMCRTKAPAYRLSQLRYIYIIIVD
ncbi:hypothetical protein GobsT_03230 [Gemmata obscuriglobus]|nr:hypothetical protein GobsT_03230 [Gemmata obscuriglobus]VTR99058.1 unnamed protein product [Gemmata obscuriglobus UQM 2246]